MPASSYIVVDARDGEVLARRAPDAESSIASATKLMTAYVARRSLRLGQTVAASPYRPLAAESLLGLESGESIAVRDLLYGLLLVSGNDAAVTLADSTAGSQDAFVAKMNAAARRLGLEHTSYANPIGLDQPGNHSSARDLADLAVELREDPALARIFDTAQYDTATGVRPRRLVNRNSLVLTVPWVDGVKTGYTLDAGYVLVGSGERGGVELVSVVLGTPSEAERDQATLDLLEYGFSLYRREQPVEDGSRLAAAEVRYQDETLPLLAGESVAVQARKEQDLDVAIDAPAEVEGPIARGERLGRATVTLDGELVERVALRAGRAVDEASAVERYDAAVPGPRAVAVAVAIAGVGAVLAGGIALLRRRPGGR